MFDLKEYASKIAEFDAEWHVDHETTVRRWDDEISGIRAFEVVPSELREAGIVAIHDLVHHLIMVQAGGDHRAWLVNGPTQTKYLRWIGQICLWRLYISTNPERIQWSRWLRSTAVERIVSSNRDLMITKNRNYGSSWSVMRSSDITGTLHTKSHRITELESGTKNEHESTEDNYRDILNYVVFALIRLSMEGGSK